MQYLRLLSHDFNVKYCAGVNVKFDQLA